MWQLKDEGLCAAVYTQLTDVETELWSCLLPPVAAALAADTTSEIVYNSMTFQVLGSKPAVGFMGLTDHVSLDLKKQIA